MQWYVMTDVKHTAVCQAPVKKQAKDQPTSPNAVAGGEAAEDVPPERTV